MIQVSYFVIYNWCFIVKTSNKIASIYIHIFYVFVFYSLWVCNYYYNILIQQQTQRENIIINYVTLLYILLNKELQTDISNIGEKFLNKRFKHSTFYEIGHKSQSKITESPVTSIEKHWTGLFIYSSWIIHIILMKISIYEWTVIPCVRAKVTLRGLLTTLDDLSNPQVETCFHPIQTLPNFPNLK